jgi:hypothetical protein
MDKSSYQGMVGENRSLRRALPFLPQVGNNEERPLGLFFFQKLLEMCYF